MAKLKIDRARDGAAIVCTSLDGMLGNIRTSGATESALLTDLISTLALHEGIKVKMRFISSYQSCVRKINRYADPELPSQVQDAGPSTLAPVTPAGECICNHAMLVCYATLNINRNSKSTCAHAYA